MAEMEMVDIHDPDNPAQKKTIPRGDYDPAVHTMWSEPMGDDPDHDSAAGPPMQDPTVAMTPESLPDEPNAAVIEAPGSKAAEMIQRQRGDEPQDISGPDEDRAEQEMERVAEVQRQADEAAAKAEEAQKQEEDKEKAEEA